MVRSECMRNPLRSVTLPRARIKDPETEVIVMDAG